MCARARHCVRKHRLVDAGARLGAEEAAQLFERIVERQGLHGLPGGLERRHRDAIAVERRYKKARKLRSGVATVALGLCVFRVLRVSTVRALETATN